MTINNSSGISVKTAAGVTPTSQPAVTPTSATDSSNSASSTGGTKGTSGTKGSSSTNSLTGTGALSEDDFLKLLVNQLQQQDPLNPMDSSQFATQLAQFSQVEQLININNKLDKSASGSTAATMAGFLGSQVALANTDGVDVTNGAGQNLYLDVPQGTHSLRVDLSDSSGQVVESLNVDTPPAGKQVLPLKDLSAADGKYSVRVVSVDEAGRFKELTPKITGTVEGFVLGADPKLLVNGQQVGLDQISEVYSG